jgi:TolB protein
MNIRTTIHHWFMFFIIVSLVISMSPVSAEDDPLKLVCLGMKDGMAKVFIVNPDGSEAIEVAVEDSIGNLTPTWSPDHQWVAFTSFVGDENPHVFIADAEGEQIMQLTTGKNYWDSAPLWSPDGTQILFKREDQADRTQSGFYMVDVETKEVTPVLVDGYRNDFAAWSPDGETLVYLSYRSKNPTVYTLDLASGKAEPFDFPVPMAFEFDWSPDGRTLLTTGLTEENFEVFSVDVESGEVTQLTDDPSFGKQLVDWSSDGEYITYSDAMYTYFQPLDDAEPMPEILYYSCDW